MNDNFLFFFSSYLFLLFSFSSVYNEMKTEMILLYFLFISPFIPSVLSSSLSLYLPKEGEGGREEERKGKRKKKGVRNKNYIGFVISMLFIDCCFISLFFIYSLFFISVCCSLVGSSLCFPFLFIPIHSYLSLFKPCSSFRLSSL